MDSSEFEARMKHYLEEHQVPGEHLRFSQSCHSVVEAAEAASAEVDDFVKNICMIGEEGQLIVAIVRGKDNASTSRVAKALNIERPRVATPEEILSHTGYPCGGTPSFGFEATFLVDPKVLDRESILTGGGSEQSLIRIKSKDLVAANNGQVIRVRR